MRYSEIKIQKEKSVCVRNGLPCDSCYTACEGMQDRPAEEEIMENGQERTPAPRRTAKDTVFTSLFRNSEYLFQLYQALHPEDTETRQEDLNIITLENIMASGIYNDLGFQLKEKLIFLIEAQSTWTVNILVRVLMYLAKSYQDYIYRTAQDVYGSRKLALPKPEIYVIYTGSRKTRPESISFAEEFFPGEECCLDVKIKMIYDGKKGDIISQYVTFTKIFDGQVKKYGLVEKAVRETIRICRERNVLKKYLEGRESEVVDIMLTLFSQEEVWDMHVRSREKEAAEEAAIKTTIEDGQDYGITKEDVLHKLRYKFELSESDALKKIEMYWQ